jgi:transcriptional regulator with XRE-family HTH domain
MKIIFLFIDFLLKFQVIRRVYRMATEPVQPPIGKMVGARLREVRKAKKLTQSQLAGEDFSVSYISAIERGQIHPSLRALEIFAQRLGLSSKELILGSFGGESLSTVALTENDEAEGDWQLLVAHIQILQGAISQAIQSLQQLLLKSISNTQRVRASYLLALAYSRMNQWQESDHMLSEATRLMKDTTSQLALRIQLLQGIIHAHIHTYRQGLELHQQCRERIDAEARPDIFLKAEVYAQLGHDMLQLERNEEARELFTAALQSTESLTPFELAAMYYELSKERLETNENFQAAMYSYKSLRIMRIIAEQARHQELHHMLGHALLQGDRDQALIYLADASAELPRDALVQASAYAQLAILELGENNVTAAKSHAKQAQALLDSNEDSLIAADALLAMGKVEYAQKRYKAGDPYFEAGLAMLERLDALEDLAEESAHYAQLLENRNDLSRAVQYWRKAYETGLKMKH